MSFWDFANLGASCEERDREYVKQLLECYGVDFGSIYESQTGYISDKYRPDIEGTTKRKSLEVLGLYLLANTLFSDVTIYYAEEYGNNTSDDYNRREKIYNPKTKKVTIGEAGYCYGTSEIFGLNVYTVLQEQIEKAALEKGIPVKWNIDMFPATEKFEAFCGEYISSIGGLSQAGRRKREEEIPVGKVSTSLIRRILTKASRSGYTKLADMINEKLELPPVAKRKSKKDIG